MRRSSRKGSDLVVSRNCEREFYHHSSLHDLLCVRIFQLGSEDARIHFAEPGDETKNLKLGNRATRIDRGDFSRVYMAPVQRTYHNASRCAPARGDYRPILPNFEVKQETLLSRKSAEIKFSFLYFLFARSPFHFAGIARNENPADR